MCRTGVATGTVKSALDLLLHRGVLEQFLRSRRTPTIMIGDVEDPQFDRHIQEGPYLVFDDAAKPEYKNDPRVLFVPGHPLLRDVLPDLMQGLGVEFPSRETREHSSSRRDAPPQSTFRKIRATVSPAILAGLAILALLGIKALARRVDVAATELHGDGYMAPLTPPWA